MQELDVELYVSMLKLHKPLTVKTTSYNTFRVVTFIFTSLIVALKKSKSNIEY